MQNQDNARFIIHPRSENESGANFRVREQRRKFCSSLLRPRPQGAMWLNRRFSICVGKLAVCHRQVTPAMKYAFGLCKDDSDTEQTPSNASFNPHSPELSRMKNRLIEVQGTTFTLKKFTYKTSIPQSQSYRGTSLQLSRVKSVVWGKCQRAGIAGDSAAWAANPRSIPDSVSLGVHLNGDRILVSGIGGDSRNPLLPGKLEVKKVNFQEVQKRIADKRRRVVYGEWDRIHQTQHSRYKSGEARLTDRH